VSCSYIKSNIKRCSGELNTSQGVVKCPTLISNLISKGVRRNLTLLGEWSSILFLYQILYQKVVLKELNTSRGVVKYPILISKSCSKGT
jgi:hypothetical protein